jgi:thiol-disulfide isomerase/thioredoxin
MNRRSQILALAACLAILFLFCTVATAADVEPKLGQSVGNVKFEKPLSAEEANYLGVPADKEFTLKDIKAPYVLVEQFNTSCPHCMHQAPILNSLYGMVQQDPQLKDKVKFLSAGQGNNEMEVKMWKAFHKVPFPVLPDPKSTLGDALNFHPYPVTMLLDKTGKIVWLHIGAFESAEEALKGIKAAAK